MHLYLNCAKRYAGAVGPELSRGGLGKGIPRHGIPIVFQASSGIRSKIKFMDVSCSHCRFLRLSNGHLGCLMGLHQCK